MTLHRNTTFGSAAANALIDDIIAQVNRGGSGVGRDVVRVVGNTATPPTVQSAPRPEGESFVSFEATTNLTDTAFLPGQLVGYDSANAPALAYALAGSIVRPFMVMVAAAGPREPIIAASAGQVYVKVEAGLTISAGNPCYLSASEAGSTTNSAPTGSNLRFTIGGFTGERNNDNLAPVVLNPGLGGGSNL